jgi:hypothetical protein
MGRVAAMPGAAPYLFLRKPVPKPNEFWNRLKVDKAKI